jgi:hypothetical protein
MTRPDVRRAQPKTALALILFALDRIFVSSRHSLKSSILLDHQRSIKNISPNDGGAI